jgi:REP element-mobilizing transposase RayT
MHHVFARGNDKACIFVDDHDYRSFLDVLADALPRFHVRCVAYCLLWNHYHLVLIPTEHRLSRLLQQLNSRYCQRFNRRHDRVGPVLQGRFGCRIVEDGLYARTVLRYLALNPVAANCAAKPEGWAWSSYRVALGLAAVPDFLSLEDTWRAFGTSDAAVGRERFAGFVAAGVQDPLVNSLLFGSPDHCGRLAHDLEPHRATREYVCSDRFAARPSLGSILDGCVEQQALADAAYIAFHQYAYTLVEIGAVVSRHPSVVSRWIEGSKQRRTSDACPQTVTSLQETRSDP